MDWRHEWFREGARALRATLRSREAEHRLPTDEDWYCCPCCLDVLLAVGAIDSGDLTIEHAPPKSLGGKALALTCKSCNNDAGRNFDAEAEKQERLRQFLAGKSERPMRVNYTAGGVTNRGNLHIAGNSFFLAGVPQANNPADVERLVEAMDLMVGTDGSAFRLDYEPAIRISPDRARISWLRTAYIVAFAALGWNYVLRPALDPLRAQFKDPLNVTVPPLSMYEPEADPARRDLMIVEEPTECRSLVVRVGRHSMFLPTVDGSRSVEELAGGLGSRNTSERVTYSMTGKLLPWPRKPQYLLDPS